MKILLITFSLLVSLTTGAFAEESSEKILASLRADLLMKYMTCSWTAAAIGYKADTLSRKAYAKEVEELAKCTDDLLATVKTGVSQLRPYVASKPQAEAQLKDFMATCLSLARRIETKPGFSEKPGAETINLKLDRLETELQW